MSGAVRATGIAYNYAGTLRIFKRPFAAHKRRFHIPNGVNVVTGRTRMATQGNARYNWNNHPFSGAVTYTKFALAHNGALWNDKDLPLRNIYRRLTLKPIVILQSN